jgi:hypothetical protein
LSIVFSDFSGIFSQFHWAKRLDYPWRNFSIKSGRKDSLRHGKGFIKAAVISYNDFKNCGNLAEARISE